MSIDIDGFQDGYLFKEAVDPATIAIAGSSAGLGIGALGEGYGKLRAISLLLPILVGVGAGASVSKLTSPSGTDTENMQKALISGELEEALAELKRKKALANNTDDSTTGKGPREIRF